jgi:hypothetical protein
MRVVTMTCKHWPILQFLWRTLKTQPTLITTISISLDSPFILISLYHQGFSSVNNRVNFQLTISTLPLSWSTFISLLSRITQTLTYRWLRFSGIGRLRTLLQPWAISIKNSVLPNYFFVKSTTRVWLLTPSTCNIIKLERDNKNVKS